jgi:hypothetical protein
MVQRLPSFPFAADGGETYPFRGKGLRLPALEQIFELDIGVDGIMSDHPDRLLRVSGRL